MKGKNYHYHVGIILWIAVYDKTIVTDDIMELQRKKQLSLKGCYAIGVPHGGDSKSNDDGDEKKVNDTNKAAAAGPMNFFLGGVLIWNEIPRKDLPSVITWQQHVLSDQTPEAWKKQLASQPYHPCVRPIFRQYSNLYTIMRPIVDLDSYGSVTSNLFGLKRAFRQPFNSPQYMPITRDMSGQSREIIKSWLENPLYCDKFVDKMDRLGGFEGDVEDLESLQSLLQAAVELEISTLPPYLSALYSMRPNSGKNVEIIKLIRSIIMEEMSHLALACNLLLATKGGEPRLAVLNFIP